MSYLVIEHAEKNFKDQSVLKDVCMEIEKGEICGLTGRNGSGKSVLFRSICGLLHLTNGRILVDGKEIGKDCEVPSNIGIAQAIMEEPEFIILDEPMNGLDDSGVKDIRKLLMELKAQGTTFLIASHNKEDIDALCDKVYHMDAGCAKKVR